MDTFITILFTILPVIHASLISEQKWRSEIAALKATLGTDVFSLGVGERRSLLSSIIFKEDEKGGGGVNANPYDGPVEIDLEELGGGNSHDLLVSEAAESRGFTLSSDLPMAAESLDIAQENAQRAMTSGHTFFRDLNVGEGISDFVKSQINLAVYRSKDTFGHDSLTHYAESWSVVGFMDFLICMLTDVLHSDRGQLNKDVDVKVMPLPGVLKGIITSLINLFKNAVAPSDEDEGLESDVEIKEEGDENEEGEDAEYKTAKETKEPDIYAIPGVQVGSKDIKKGRKGDRKGRRNDKSRSKDNGDYIRLVIFSFYLYFFFLYFYLSN
jgi:hypothetical protein